MFQEEFSDSPPWTGAAAATPTNITTTTTNTTTPPLFTPEKDIVLANMAMDNFKRPQSAN